MTPKAIGQRCEAQHMQPGVKKPQRHNARLGIFIARVLPDHCRTEIGLGHPLEAQAPRSRMLRSFFASSNPISTAFIVITICWKCKDDLSGNGGQSISREAPAAPAETAATRWLLFRSCGDPPSPGPIGWGCVVRWLCWCDEIAAGAPLLQGTAATRWWSNNEHSPIKKATRRWLFIMHCPCGQQRDQKLWRMPIPKLLVLSRRR